MQDTEGRLKADTTHAVHTVGEHTAHVVNTPAQYESDIDESKDISATEEELKAVRAHYESNSQMMDLERDKLPLKIKLTREMRDRQRELKQMHQGWASPTLPHRLCRGTPRGSRLQIPMKTRGVVPLNYHLPSMTCNQSLNLPRDNIKAWSRACRFLRTGKLRWKSTAILVIHQPIRVHHGEGHDK